MNTRAFFGMFAILTLLYAGCTQHTIRVEQEKPLRVDVNMRIDVYQHVLEQSNTIEDMINQPGGQSFLIRTWQRLASLDFTSSVYAQDSQFDDATMQAIKGRQERRDQIVSWGEQGIIGENNNGYVELYAQTGLSDQQIEDLNQLIDLENKDRSVIYETLAKQQGTSVEEVGKVYSITLQKNAPSGMPIQSTSGEWAVK